MKRVPLKWADFGKNGAVFRNGGVGRPVGRNSEPAGRFRRKTSGHTDTGLGPQSLHPLPLVQKNSNFFFRE